MASIIEESQRNTKRCPRPAKPADVLTAARAFGVVYAPPLLLDLGIGACLVATAKRALRRPRTTRCASLPSWLVALGTAAPALYLFAARPWLLRWGATRHEVRRPLPGDELVPEPWIESTRAVTIHAPAGAVWSWLAQIGQDRGGFYSFEWLENLAGCRMRNADRVHPEWQRREVGERVPLHPQAGLKVTRYEPDRVLALEGWGAFVLEPIDQQRTRLIARSRLPWSWRNLVLGPLGEIPHFIMERQMLLGIKERAERAWSDQANAESITPGPIPFPTQSSDRVEVCAAPALAR